MALCCQLWIWGLISNLYLDYRNDDLAQFAMMHVRASRFYNKDLAFKKRLHFKYPSWRAKKRHLPCPYRSVQTCLRLFTFVSYLQSTSCFVSSSVRFVTTVKPLLMIAQPKLRPPIASWVHLCTCPCWTSFWLQTADWIILDQFATMNSGGFLTNAYRLVTGWISLNSLCIKVW